MNKLYQKIESLSNSKYADALLGLWFFTESIIFPIPPDPALIFYCLKRPSKSFYYGVLGTTLSVAGGVVAYFIGGFLWNSLGLKIIAYTSSMQVFEKVCYQYKLYEYWAVLVAGFTPIPYKAITLTAGFCRLPLTPFIICSIISRGARYMIIALLAKRYGPQIRSYIDRYGTFLTIIFIIICLIGYIVL